MSVCPCHARHVFWVGCVCCLCCEPSPSPPDRPPLPTARPKSRPRPRPHPVPPSAPALAPAHAQHSVRRVHDAPHPLPHRLHPRVHVGKHRRARRPPLHQHPVGGDAKQLAQGLRLPRVSLEEGPAHVALAQRHRRRRRAPRGCTPDRRARREARIRSVQCLHAGRSRSSAAASHAGA